MEKIAPCELAQNIWFRLSREAKEDLTKSGISTDYQAKMGCIDVTTNEEVEEILGHHDFPKESGKPLLHQTKAYVIRYPDGYRRLKLLNPVAANNGTVKYLSPCGEKESNPFHLYFLPDYSERLKKKGIVIWTEGEKKAACVQQWLDKEGYKNAIAIGFPGITMWRGCFDKLNAQNFNFSGRKFYIAFDAKDIYEENSDVQREAFCLWLELHRRKVASVEFLYWQADEEPKSKGIDDYLLNKKADDSPLKTLIETATGNPFEFLTLLTKPVSGSSFAAKCFGKSHLLKETVQKIFKEFRLMEIYSQTFNNFYAQVTKEFDKKDDGEKETPSTPWSSVIKTISTNKKNVNYVVTPEGIFKIIQEKNFSSEEKEITINEKICADPVYIAERLVDLFNSTSQVKIVWSNRSAVVPTSCLSGNDMKELTNLGIRILTVNGTDMAQYFLASLDQLELGSNFSSKNGWLDTKGVPKHSALIFGQKMLSQSGEETLARFENETVDLSTAGNQIEWCKLVNKYYQEDPILQIAMGASAAAFLTAPLHVENAIVHFFGQSSTGKSTRTKFASSIWGQPDMTQKGCIRKNWNSSPTGTETYFETMGGFPCILEDSNDENDDDKISKIVQYFVNGTGKTRSTVKKGQGVISDFAKTWQTILLSTGERKLTDSSSMDGVTARTIEVYVKMQKRIPQSEFLTMQRVLSENFGFGVELIKYWFAKKEEITNIFENFMQQIEKTMGNDSDENIKQRSIGMFALICTGCYLLQQVFGFKPNYDEISNVILNSLNEKESKNKKGLYESLVEYYVSNSKRFGKMQLASSGKYTYVSSDDKDELGVYHPCIHGIQAAVCFYSDKLKLHLKKHKFSISQFNLLKDDGKLVTSPKRGNCFAIKILGTTTDVYAIKLENIQDNDNI